MVYLAYKIYASLGSGLRVALTPTPRINYVLFCILCKYTLYNVSYYNYTPKQCIIDPEARPRHATPTRGVYCLKSRIR